MQYTAVSKSGEVLEASAARTMFITCIRGLIARNFLATEAFSRLAERTDFRIVVIAPEQNVPALEREFGRPNVLFEGISVPAKEIPDGFDRLLWTIATNLLPTKTRAVQRRVKFALDGNRFDYAASTFVGFLGNMRWVRKAFRFFIGAFLGSSGFERLFERYRPDLLFATDIYAFQDVKFMRLAHRLGVKAVGMVRSWDNVTSKTLLMHIPDEVVVNGPRIRDELVWYGDVPADRVSVIGVPHYDRYRPGDCMPRAEFFRKFGFDERRKLVLFATPSDRYLRDNFISPLVVDALGGSDVHVLVRPPLVGRSGLEGQRLPPNVRLDDPGDYGDFVNLHMDRRAERHLADSLNAADVVVTWASTMIVDAAAFGKPVVLVGFDETPRPYHQSILQYYDYEHHQFILASGGVRLAKSPKELFDWAMRYIEDPALDGGGRARIVEDHCGALDGRAGERLAVYIINAVS